MAEEQDPFLLARDIHFRDSEAKVLPDIRYPEDRVPLLGQSRPPLGISCINIGIEATGTPPTRLVIARPQILMAVGINGTIPTQIDITYTPHTTPAQISASAVTPERGLASNRGVCYLWSPGIWWITCAGDSAGSVKFARIPADNPDVLKLFLESFYGGRGISSLTSTVLAAATVTDVIDAEQSLQLEYLRIENVGANDARIDFGVGVPSGASGLRIAANGVLELAGRNFPTGRLRAFSTGGTTLMLQQAARSFNFDV